jgi:hypothetical protein
MTLQLNYTVAHLESTKYLSNFSLHDSRTGLYSKRRALREEDTVGSACWIADHLLQTRR